MDEDRMIRDVQAEAAVVASVLLKPDLIFYPEKPFQDSEAENLIRMVCNCDERSVEVVKATAKALIGSSPSQS